MLHNNCYTCSCACLQHSESTEVLQAGPPPEAALVPAGLSEVPAAAPHAMLTH